MDPAFWNNLPAIIVAIGGFWAVLAQTRKSTAEVKRDVNRNTDVTVMGNAEVRHEIAKTAQTTEKIKETLNGGPNGLASLTARVAALEAQYTEVVRGVAALESGQSEIVKSLAQLAEVVDRKLGKKES